MWMRQSGMGIGTFPVRATLPVRPGNRTARDPFLEV